MEFVMGVCRLKFMQIEIVSEAFSLCVTFHVDYFKFKSLLELSFVQKLYLHSQVELETCWKF